MSTQRRMIPTDGSIARIGRRLTLLGACALTVVAACAGDDGIDAGSPALDVDPAALRPVLRDRIHPPSDRVSIEMRRIEENARCLEDRGFEVIRPSAEGITEGVMFSSTLDRVRFGVPATYNGGLGIVTFLELSGEIGTTQVLPADDYGSAFFEADAGDLNGTGDLVEVRTEDVILSFDADGCTGRSYLETFGSAEGIGVYTQTLGQLQSAVDDRLWADPSVELALTEWRTCASREGRNLTTPDEVSTIVTDAFNDHGAASARDLENELSAVLRRCEDESGLYEAALAAQPAVEEVVLTEWSGKVAALREVIAIALAT